MKSELDDQFTTYVALLRGINVGGRNKLPMKELKRIVTGLGASNVAAYIQSGNLVFGHDETDEGAIALKISEAIADEFGYAVQVLVIVAEEFRSIAAANPFPEAEREPKSLHFYFCSETPGAPDLSGLEACAKHSERFKLLSSCLYLYAPEGIGRSKLAASIERSLGVPTTARNLNTVSAVLALIE